MAQSIGKYELLGSLAPAIKDADGALVFTETVRAANHAINRLDPLVSIDLITGSTARRQRREILDDLRVRRLDAVAAPRVLDEGIDVPDANLGIVMSASRTRRQMIQRMGRILRRKRPGVAARFVIMFAKDTLEDPANRIERDGFLDEIERISEATGVFDSAHFEALDAFLAAAGPGGRARARASRALRARRGSGRSRAERSTMDESLADELGVEAAYALLSFARRDRSDPRREAAIRRLDARLPQPKPDAPYLELELAEPAARSPSRGSSRSGCRPGRRRSRSRASGPRGGSAAPAAAKHHRSSSSGGRSSTRPWPAAATEFHAASRAAPRGTGVR